MAKPQRPDPFLNLDDGNKIYIGDIEPFTGWLQIHTPPTRLDQGYICQIQTADDWPADLYIADPAWIQAQRQTLERANALAQRHPYARGGPLILHEGTCNHGQHAFLLVDVPSHVARIGPQDLKSVMVCMEIASQTAVYLHQRHQLAGPSIPGNDWAQHIIIAYDRLEKTVRANGLDLALLRQARALFDDRKACLNNRPDSMLYGRMTLDCMARRANGVMHYLEPLPYAHGDPWYDLRTIITEIHPRSFVVASSLIDAYTGMMASVQFFNCLAIYAIVDALKLYADSLSQPGFDRSAEVLRFRQTARQLQNFNTTVPVWYKPLKWRPRQRRGKTRRPATETGSRS